VADPHTRQYPIAASPASDEAEGSPWTSAAHCSQSLATPDSRDGALLASGLEQLRLWHRLKTKTTAVSAAGVLTRT
jgi:hypothetical protein